MKSKKLLSTFMVSALVATTMAVPVMADDGGEVDVDVSTKTAVIRVVVPTSLQVAVNQFEKEDTGSQIYSAKFGMENKSEIPVKVTVDSTATLASTDPITLVQTKAAVETSEEEEAWLAVAAEVDDGKFIDGNDSEGNPKTIKDLTEASENVTTFVQGTDAAANSGTAQQIFYLGAASAPNSVTYTKLAPTDAEELANAKKTAYAQIYAVSELTLAAGSEQADLNRAIAAGNVYAETGNTITRIEKGSSETHASGTQYYSEGALTAAKDIAQGTTYIYGEAAAGDKAGFRYLGTLSEAKETWTATDINHIKIEYDIKGVTTTKYGEVVDDCTYGLYASAPAEAAPSIETTSYALVADTPVEINVNLGSGTLGATTVSKVTDTSGASVAKGTQWTYENGKVSFTTTRVNALLGAKVDKVYIIHFDDANKTSVNVTLKGSGK